MALTKVTGSVIKDSVSLSGNVSVGGTLTYQDVTNVDALGIGTFRTGIKVLAGQVDVGSNIKLGNAGVVTATTFSGSAASLTSIPAGNLTGTVADARISTLTASKLSGALPAISGANLTSLPAQATIANNADNRVITGGSGVNLNGESTLTYDGDGLLTMTSSSGPAELTLVAPSANDSGIYFNDGSNDGAISYDHSTRNMNFRANSQTKFRIEGDTKTLKIQRAPSSDVDIVLARAQRWGYSSSWQGLIIGNPAVGSMSSLFLNYDPSNNPSGSFAGDGREIVVRKNAKIIVPNAADNAFYNAIEFNCGGSRDDGVSRFRQGILVSNDSADANVLDDYEEGTYTPAITYDSADSGNKTYQTRHGTYTKIGRVVTANFYIELSNRGTGNGTVAVSLPFTVGSYLNSTSLEAGGVIHYFTGLMNSWSDITVSALDGLARCRMYGISGQYGSSSVGFEYSAVSNSFNIRGSITYQST